MGILDPLKSPLRIGLLVTALLVLGACHFVQRGGGETEFQNHCYELAVIEQAIERAEQTRNSRLDFRIWYIHRQEEERDLIAGSDWDECLGRLYALKSTCSVRHAPVVIISKEFFEFGWEGRLPLFCLCSLFLIPIDLVQLPLQLPYRAYQHLMVTDEDMEAALEALARARAFGFDRDYHTIGDMFFVPKHLDRIGYELPAVDPED